MNNNTNPGNKGSMRRQVGPAGSPAPEGETLYARNSRTISGRLHDELVMMDLEQGKYFSLNPVATRIWELLETPSDIAEICKRLMDEYDVVPEHCRFEVEEHLAEMVRLGLVLVSRESA